MRAFNIVVVCFLAAGCAAKHEHVRPLWTKDAFPPRDLAAPSGFSVTPAQALAAVRDSGTLSLKHYWYVYADSRYYYIDDAFLGSNARTAYQRGRRVDGQTGEFVPR
jgi:hypothetical protein